MKLRLGLLAALALTLIAPLAHAENCNSIIIDKAGVIFSPAVITNATRTLINQGADVHVVTVDSITRYGNNLTDVERYFEQSCPSWTTNGQRKANLFVVMVAPNDRQKNMFLGSLYAGAFDIPSTYSQLSNTYFKNRQWEMGLAAVLQGTTNSALSFRNQQSRLQQQQAPVQHAYTAPVQTTQTTDASDSHIGIWIFGFIVLGLVGLTLFLLFRRGSEETTYTSTSTTPDTDTTGVSQQYTGSYPNRSYAATAPSGTPVQHTTIINNNPSSGDGLLTGIVVGEMLSRPSTVYVEPSAPTYVEPTPTYTEPAPTQAPDSTWENTQSAPDTSFTPEPESTPSYDPPSTDFGGGGDSSFGGGSDFGGGSSGGDSGF